MLTKLEVRCHVSVMTTEQIRMGGGVVCGLLLKTYLFVERGVMRKDEKNT